MNLKNLTNEELVILENSIREEKFSRLLAKRDELTQEFKKAWFALINAGFLIEYDDDHCANDVLHWDNIMIE